MHDVTAYVEDRQTSEFYPKRGWLPPSYGKKQYADMSAEEQAVVDSFQGATEYAKVMQNPAYYLAAPVKAQNLLGMGEGV